MSSDLLTIESASRASTPPPAAPGNLRRRAVSGAAWSGAGYAASQALRLAGNLILTRWLFPEAFGLIALVQIFLQGLEMFSDMGVGPALVRDARGAEPRFANTAWSMQVTRGVALWLCALAAAAPLAWLYSEPLLAQLLPVAGLSAVLAGFAATDLFIASRRLNVRAVVLVEFGAQACGLTVMLASAWLHPCVWALVWGGLASSAAKTALSHLLVASQRNWFAWDREAAQALMGFGKWILASSAVYFVSLQLDRLLLGYFVAPALLGVYTVAVLLAELPVALNKRLTRQVLYPLLSAAHRERPQALAADFARGRRWLDVVFLPALGALMALAQPVVDLLYDPRYAAAGWMLSLLCLRTAMRCLLEPAETALVALGAPRYALWQHLVRLGWIAVALPLAWHEFGIHGLVTAAALSEIPVLPVLWSGLARHGLLRPVLECRAIALFAGSWLLVGALWRLGSGS